MKTSFKILAAILAVGLGLPAQAQQPIISVSVTGLTVDGVVQPSVNEASGPALRPIGITATAVGTFLTTSFTYTFYVNGISIGQTQGPVNPPDYPTVFWTPPQPGSYFITVMAADGVSTATSLPIRYFATGTTVTSPVGGTLVPLGSSIVLKADATVGKGFIKEIQFYANGNPIGAPDRTLPYSLIYTPNLGAGNSVTITARALDNNNAQVPMSPGVQLDIVTPIQPLASSTITSPLHETPIAIPTASGANIPITVDAFSSSGRITKVELYIDGELFGTDNNFPYTFEWLPTVVGSYYLVALAYDDKNNVIASTTSTEATSTPAPTKVIVAAPPSVTLIAPTTGSTVSGESTTNLRATATDSGGNPITKVEFYVNDTLVGVTDAPQDGVYSITAIVPEARDSEGNVLPSTIVARALSSEGLTGTSNAASVTVTKGGGSNGPVIGQPPIAHITSPANATTFRTGFGTLLTASASDPDGIIGNVQFFANDVKVGSADTTPPYTTTWTPTADGSYRLTAVATDDKGNTTTSSTIHVQVSSSAAMVGAVYSGSYQRSLAESGRFALATYGGGKVAFIGRATTGSGVYFKSELPLGSAGVFSSAEGTSISGTATDVFASGSIGGTPAAAFSGPVIIGAGTIPAGYYAGAIAGTTSGTFAAIAGADGSIAVYVQSGDYQDGGFGTIGAAGSFQVLLPSGNQITGSIDAASGLLSGELIGGPGGSLTAAITRAKVSGTAYEYGSDIVHPNGNVYDQMLMTGGATTVVADPGQVIRTSFIDLTGDIVQVEFSGAGTLTISLASASGPAVAAKYNQPSIVYMKGHASVTIVGADETSNISIFSVGRINAVNQSLFLSEEEYDGVADVALLQISSPSGRFGGVRMANAGFLGSSGFVGLYAPGVTFEGPVRIHDIAATDGAIPMLLTGSIGTSGEILVAGGSLGQPNSAAIRIGGATRVVMAAGTTSHGVPLPAQANAGVLERDGQNVTSAVIVPAP